MSYSGKRQITRMRGLVRGRHQLRQINKYIEAHLLRRGTSTSRHMFKVKCPITPHKAPTWAYLQKYVTTTSHEDALFGFVHTTQGGRPPPYLFFIRIFQCRKRKRVKCWSLFLQEELAAISGVTGRHQPHRVAELLLSKPAELGTCLFPAKTLQVASKYFSTSSRCRCHKP